VRSNQTGKSYNTRSITSERLGALYLRAFGARLRHAEALGPRWDSVNFETKEVRMTQSLQWLARKPVFVEPKNRAAARSHCRLTWRSG
jgi:hypothetical protein